jgi:hypothetical protein
MSFYKLNWRKGAKCVKLVVGCSLLVDVSVHGGMLTITGSWWGKNVITQKKFNDKLAMSKQHNMIVIEYWCKRDYDKRIEVRVI